MVRTKSGAIAKGDRKLIDDLNNKLMGLRRQQIAAIQQHAIASQQHQTELIAIKTNIEELCKLVDQLSKGVPSKKNAKSKRVHSPEPDAPSEQSSLSPRNTANEATSMEVVRRSSRKIIPTLKSELDITPSPARISSRREAISQVTSVSRLMRYHQATAAAYIKSSASKQITKSYTTTTSSHTESRKVLSFVDCTPCSVPLRDCKRSLRKHKKATL